MFSGGRICSFEEMIEEERERERGRELKHNSLVSYFVQGGHRPTVAISASGHCR